MFLIFRTGHQKLHRHIGKRQVLDSQWTVPLSKAVIMHTETFFFSFPPCAFFWIHFVVITVFLLLAPVAFYPLTMHLSCRLDCFLFYSSLLKLWILNKVLVISFFSCRFHVSMFHFAFIAAAPTSTCTYTYTYRVYIYIYMCTYMWTCLFPIYKGLK